MLLSVKDLAPLPYVSGLRFYDARVHGLLLDPPLRSPLPIRQSKLQAATGLKYEAAVSPEWNGAIKVVHTRWLLESHSRKREFVGCSS